MSKGDFKTGDRVAFALKGGRVITGVITSVEERADRSRVITFEQFPDAFPAFPFAEEDTGGQ